MGSQPAMEIITAFGAFVVRNWARSNGESQLRASRFKTFAQSGARRYQVRTSTLPPASSPGKIGRDPMDTHQSLLYRANKPSVAEVDSGQFTMASGDNQSRNENGDGEKF